MKWFYSMCCLYSFFPLGVCFLFYFGSCHLILHSVCNLQDFLLFSVGTHFSEPKYFFLFSSCRQQLLKVTFESPPISPKSPSSAVKCRTPRQKGQACKSSFLSNYFQKKPKTSPSKELWAPSSISLPVEETETGGSHRSNQVDLHSSSTPLVVKEEPMDVEEENFQLLKSVKQEGTAWPSHTSALQAAHSSPPPIDIKPIIKGDALLSPSVTHCDAFWGTSLLSSASTHLLVTCHHSHLTCLKHVSLSHEPQQWHQSGITSFDEESDT